MASPANARGLRDNNLIVAGTLPNAANLTNTNSIDLTTATPYPLTEVIVVKIENTASANMANSKNMNFALQESADNTTFTNIAGMGVMPVRSLNANVTALAAGCTLVALPPGVMRYLRLGAKGEASGGDAGDGTFTMSILF